MARLGTPKPTGHRVLVVDDDPALRDSTARLLALEGHEVRAVPDTASALAEQRAFRPQCVLLDYFLASATSEALVGEMRAFDPEVQIVLVTGYASDQPARAMMRRLDIQGYHDKTDGPEKLLVWVDAALKSYRAVSLLARRAAAMRTIAESAHAIHRVQTLAELLETALDRLLRIVEATSGVIATNNGGLLVTTESNQRRIVGPRRGRFEPFARYDELPGPARELLDAVLEGGSERAERDALIAVGLCLADRRIGACLLEAPAADAVAEPLSLFAAQVALAMENGRLYELATVDSLTRLASRGHAMQRLTESLKLAARTGQPLTVLSLDVDHFKRVNDTLGHAAGDMVLFQVAESLRRTVRDTDFAARFGGEEFLVLAPATPVAGAPVLAERLRAAVEARRTDVEGKAVGVTTSGGYGTVDLPARAGGGWVRDPAWWDEATRTVLAAVDRALYAAKAAGRNRMHPTGAAGAIELPGAT
ncbi:MAG: diguanylate cyclase [Myxococcales bacterium]|nr:diguanylate cyclase [Myxococcales bacterium]